MRRGLASVKAPPPGAHRKLNAVQPQPVFNSLALCWGSRVTPQPSRGGRAG